MNDFELREMGALAVPQCSICARRLRVIHYEGFVTRRVSPQTSVTDLEPRAVLVCDRCDLTGRDHSLR